MAIGLESLLTPEKKLLIVKISQTIDELLPAIQEGVDQGLPLSDHLTWFRDKQQWIAKFRHLFKIPNEMTT